MLITSWDEKAGELVPAPFLTGVSPWQRAGKHQYLPLFTVWEVKATI